MQANVLMDAVNAKKQVFSVVVGVTHIQESVLIMNSMYRYLKIIKLIKKIGSA